MFKKLFICFILSFFFFSSLVVAETLDDKITFTSAFETKLEDLRFTQDSYKLTETKYFYQEKTTDKDGITSFVHEFLRPTGERGYLIYLEEQKDNMIYWQEKYFWDDHANEIFTGKYSINQIDVNSSTIDYEK